MLPTTTAFCFFQHACQQLALLPNTTLPGRVGDVISYLPQNLRSFNIPENAISEVVFTGIPAHLPHPNASVVLGPQFFCTVGTVCEPEISGQLYAVSGSEISARDACNGALERVDLPRAFAIPEELLLCSEMEGRKYVAGNLFVDFARPEISAAACVFGGRCEVRLSDYGISDTETLEISGRSEIFRPTNQFSFDFGVLSGVQIGEKFPLIWRDGQGLEENLGLLEISGIFPGNFSCGLGSPCLLSFNGTDTLTPEISSIVSLEISDSCTSGLSATSLAFEGHGKNFNVTISDSTADKLTICWSADRKSQRLPVGLVSLVPPTLVSGRSCSLGEECKLIFETSEKALATAEVWASSVGRRCEDGRRDFPGFFSGNFRVSNSTVNLGKVSRIVDTARNFQVCFKKQAVVGSLGEFELLGPVHTEISCVVNAECWLEVKDGLLFTGTSDACEISDHTPFRGVRASALEPVSWGDRKFFLGRPQRPGEYFACWRNDGAGKSWKLPEISGVAAKVTVQDAFVARGCWSMSEDDRKFPVISVSECASACDNAGLYGLFVQNNSTSCRCLTRNFQAVTKMESAECSARCKEDRLPCGSDESPRLVSIYAAAVTQEAPQVASCPWGERCWTSAFSEFGSSSTCQQGIEISEQTSPASVTLRLASAGNDTDSEIAANDFRVAYHPGPAYRGVSLAGIDAVSGQVTSHAFFPADDHGRVSGVADLESALRDLTDFQIATLVTHNATLNVSDFFTARLLLAMQVDVGNATALHSLAAVSRAGHSLAASWSANASLVSQVNLTVALEPVAGCVVNELSGERRLHTAFRLEGPELNQSVTCVAGAECRVAIKGVNLQSPAAFYFAIGPCTEASFSRKIFSVAQDGFSASTDLGVFQTRSEGSSTICYGNDTAIGNFRVLGPAPKSEQLTCTAGQACELSFQADDAKFPESAIYLNPLGDCKAQVGIRVTLKRQEKNNMLIYALAPERSADLFGDFAICWTYKRSVPAVVDLGTLAMEEEEDFDL